MGVKTPRPAREQGPSLVRRLVMLAAGWSLAVLLVAGVSLSLFFAHTATVRLDDALSDTVTGLLAGTSVEGGVVAPPDSVVHAPRSNSPIREMLADRHARRSRRPEGAGHLPLAVWSGADGAG